jgi:hypothetical protein
MRETGKDTTVRIHPSHAIAQQDGATNARRAAGSPKQSMPAVPPTAVPMVRRRCAHPAPAACVLYARGSPLKLNSSNQWLDKPSLVSTGRVPPRSKRVKAATGGTGVTLAEQKGQGPH